MVGTRFGVALAAALVLLSGTAAAAPTVPRIAWSPCYGALQCGTAQVPLDYSDPGGAAISLALIKLPATDPAHRIGSLFLNPGGPGGSGVDFVHFAGPFLYTAEVRARFDLVGFDPRGIARSTALRCFGTDKQWAPIFTPFAFPLTPEQEQVWIAGELYLDSSCAQRGGRIADHMATADVARDLDLLRQAVGDAGLTYAGFSYGSYLGVTYANLFPAKVRALIVDGVLDPVAWATGTGNEGSTIPFSTRLRSDAGAQATLNEFFRLCDAGGARCALAPNSAARFATLLAKAKAHPTTVVLPDGSVVPFEYTTAIGVTLGMLYDSLGWEDFAQTLAFIEKQVDPAILGRRLQPLLEPPAYIAKRGFPHYRNGVEGFPAVACSDSDNPHAYSAWSAAGAAADATFGYFGRIWTWASSICAAWPSADADRYTGPFTRRTANPVLVVGNLFDPATRYEGAVKVASLLPSSRLLTVHGWGHTSLFLSQCADEIATRYLVAMAVPPAGAVCSQDHVPFSGP